MTASESLGYALAFIFFLGIGVSMVYGFIVGISDDYKRRKQDKLAYIRCKSELEEERRRLSKLYEYWQAQLDALEEVQRITEKELKTAEGKEEKRLLKEMIALNDKIRQTKEKRDKYADLI